MIVRFKFYPEPVFYDTGPHPLGLRTGNETSCDTVGVTTAIMAVPTYDELLAKRRVTTSAMEQTFDRDDLQKFSLELDRWEKLARFIGIPTPEIENIKSQGDMDEQKIKMLVCWKQRRGSMATYEAMARALLQIGRTDLAEEVIAFRCPVSVLQNTVTDSDTQAGTQTEPSNEPLQVTGPPSPGNSSGIGEMSPDPRTPAVLPPFTVLSNPIVHTAQQEVVISHLKELEEEFYKLVTFTETTLKEKDNEECLERILRRFSMLPQSIRRKHQTDENYVATRQRILNSKTIKELFDNLTALKHWSYMMPDTLAHIVQDIKSDDVKQKIDKYRMKLTAFKAKTELKDIIGLRFPIPDYCIELTIEVDNWEGKTIDEAEAATLNILRKAAYGGGIGWKAVNPGSTKMIFIFLEPTANINTKVDGFAEICKDNGVVTIQIEEEGVYSNDYPTAISDNEENKMMKVAI